MKKCLLLLLAGMLVVLPGCKPDSSSALTSSTPAVSSPPEPDVVEIRVVTSYGGDDGNRQNYERAMRDFEAQTGNIVRDDSAISNEEWKISVMSSFEDGTQPDVLFYFTGADSDRIVENRQVVSLEEIRSVYPDYASNMKDSLLPRSPVDGKSYAVPVNGYWEGLYVNKRVLAECGVDVPDASTTWEQFLNDCQKIADNGYIPIAASLHEVPHYWFEYCVFNNGSVDTHAELPDSASDSVGEAWAAGLSDIKELYTKGFFPEDTLTASSSEADVLMIDYKAAFMIDGSWKMGWFAENAADINNFTVTYVPAKNERLPTDIIGGLSMGYFITREAWDDPAKRDACVQFVSAMTSDEVVTTFGATAVTALVNSPVLPEGSSGLVKDALAMTRNSTSNSPATADGLPTNARRDLFANIANVVTGDMTPQQAIYHCLSSSN